MNGFVLRDSVTGNMTDEEFFTFCVENSQLRIERNSNGEICIMSPTSTLGGKFNSEILRQLLNWNVQAGKGEVFDSSTGFMLPDKSVFSPDASWMRKEIWNRLTLEEKDRFAPVCPEFVIEVRSKSDDINVLRSKMHNWIANGAGLGWLVDPYEQEVLIYRGDKSIALIKGFDQKILGEGLVDGFQLDLSLLKP